MTDALPLPLHDAQVQLHDAVMRQLAQRALLAAVAEQPWAHDFFALQRRLDALRPEAPRTGHALRPQQEALRFSQPPELDFAPAALSALEFREAMAPRLSVRFFGLLGPQGPMPLHITEFVRERLHRQTSDAGPAHFLDLFHHRLVSLFYRAWAQAQPVVQADRPQDDRFLAWLLAAAGQPSDLSALPARALAYNAGLLAGRTRHPEALCKVLRQQFGVPVALQAHVGQWMLIQREDQSRLGYAQNRRERATSPRAHLGQQANAGNKVWDRQYRFRLQLGPLTLVQYISFLPGGPSWPALNAWVRQLAGPSLRWDLSLVLAPTERPRPALGKAQAKGTRLGVSTWLGTAHEAGPNAPTEAGPAPIASVTPRRALRQGLRLRPGTSFLQRRSEA